MPYQWQGQVRDHSSAALKALDIGYGYTADHGQTYPFRGQFIGQMRMLDEVLEKFPDARFLINIKSRSKTEGQKLVAYLAGYNAGHRVMVYGHPDSIAQIST